MGIRNLSLSRIPDGAVTGGKLSTALRAALPTFTLTATDNADGTATLELSCNDAAGQAMALQLARLWTAADGQTAPSAEGTLSVVTGTLIKEVTADALLEVLAEGAAIVVTLTAADGDYEAYAAVGGVVLHAAVTITGNP